MTNKTQTQCAKCPWKTSTDPYDIPNGYCPTKHQNLKSTISDGEFNLFQSLNAMACHESPVGAEVPCVGWLHNQLGVGNNIGLRLALINGSIKADYKIFGEQHICFADTLPPGSEDEDCGYE